MSYAHPGYLISSAGLAVDLDHPDAVLRSALDAKGLLDSPRVIAYCDGGILASVDAFAYLLTGHDNVPVYDGSMAE